MHLITSLVCVAALFLSQAVSATRPLSRVLTDQAGRTYPLLASNPLKVPGESPAYYCSDPTDDIFHIRRFDLIPTNVRVGYYLKTRFIGNFTSSTGDSPWLNITGVVNGRPELSPLYNSLLCDIDVYQEIKAREPGGDPDALPRLHRACPPGIKKGYAVVSSLIPLYPPQVPVGRYEVRAEAMTQDGRRIFCVQGSFNVTT